MFKEPQQSEGFISRSNENKKLSYVDRFKNLIENRPNLISDFLHIEQKIQDDFVESKAYSGNMYEQNGLKITLISASPSEGEEIPYQYMDKNQIYMKAEIGNDVYFVKSKPGYLHFGGLGADEFESTRQARDLLKSLDNVGVIDFQIGYQDKRKRTYYVSGWSNDVRLDQYINRLNYDLQKYTNIQDNFEAIDDGKKKEIVDIRERIEKIKSLLGGGIRKYEDIQTYNMLYNPNTKKITIFDVHINPNYIE